MLREDAVRYAIVDAAAGMQIFYFVPYLMNAKHIFEDVVDASRDYRDIRVSGYNLSVKFPSGGTIWVKHVDGLNLMSLAGYDIAIVYLDRVKDLLLPQYGIKAVIRIDPDPPRESVTYEEDYYDDEELEDDLSDLEDDLSDLEDDAVPFI